MRASSFTNSFWRHKGFSAQCSALVSAPAPERISYPLTAPDAIVEFWSDRRVKSFSNCSEPSLCPRMSKALVNQPSTLHPAALLAGSLATGITFASMMSCTSLGTSASSSLLARLPTALPYKSAPASAAASLASRRASGSIASNSAAHRPLRAEGQECTRTPMTIASSAPTALPADFRSCADVLLPAADSHSGVATRSRMPVANFTCSAASGSTRKISSESPTTAWTVPFGGGEDFNAVQKGTTTLSVRVAASMAARSSLPLLGPVSIILRQPRARTMRGVAVGAEGWAMRRRTGKTWALRAGVEAAQIPAIASESCSHAASEGEDAADALSSNSLRRSGSVTDRTCGEAEVRRRMSSLQPVRVASSLAARSASVIIAIAFLHLSSSSRSSRLASSHNNCSPAPCCRAEPSPEPVSIAADDASSSSLSAYSFAGCTAFAPSFWR
mmetsp:Transcript_45411/g.106666  ORF Transcript_45411/g.106666 Transcript_45411/m.106666 type:complete len:444 (-) Transcript_45411:1381-2712(-)